MSLSRRDLMKWMGAAGVTASLSPAFAQATSIDPNHRYLFVNFEGGWDHTMCLDPRDPANDAMKQQTGIEMGWQHLPPSFARTVQRPMGSAIAFGPAIGGLARHFNKLCVVRGMSMDTLSHPVGARYFATGKPPSGLTPRGNSAASEVVEQLARSHPQRLEELANFAIDADAFYTGNRTEVRAFRASALSPLTIAASFKRGLLFEGDFALDPLTSGTENLLAAHRARAFCDPARVDASGAMTRVRQAQAKNERLFEGGALMHFSTRPENEPEWSRYGAPPQPGTPALAAFFARQALAKGVSNAVTVTLQSGLDTHTSAHPEVQPTRLKAGFDALATLIDDLEATAHPSASGSLLEHTTIVVYSEFTRTAVLNAAGGRDHSLTNSCVLLGAGIKGNTVVGASSDVGMQPQAINVMTGAVDPMGTVIRPEHVLATALEAGGFDSSHLLVPGLPCARR